MKLDDDFSFIYVCPLNETQRLGCNAVEYSHGICPVCGHDNNGTITHSKKIVGKWNRAGFFDVVLRNKQDEFIPLEKLAQEKT